MSEEMRLVPLIVGMTARDIWPLLNIALPAWLLLAAVPRWKWTQTLTLIPPTIHAAIYLFSIATLMMTSDEQADMFTLEGVVEAFKDPNVVFIGWVHYLVFDLLVGRAISADAVSRGCSSLLYVICVVPCLFLVRLRIPCCCSLPRVDVYSSLTVSFPACSGVTDANDWASGVSALSHLSSDCFTRTKRKSSMNCYEVVTWKTSL